MELSFENREKLRLAEKEALDQGRLEYADDVNPIRWVL